MSKQLLHNPQLMSLLGISYLGLCIVGLFAHNPPLGGGDVLWRKQFIGILFAVTCIFGMLAVIFPTFCSRIFYFGNPKHHSQKAIVSTPTQKNPFSSQAIHPTIQGHHPDCGHFSLHILHINNHTFCAGCTGLFIGSLTAFIGGVLYFFPDRLLDPHNLLIWVGILGVAIGLLQFPLQNIRSSSIRLLQNTFFILSFFFILIGIDTLLHSLLIDVFILSFEFFWLFTRIVFSRWSHTRICHLCQLDCIHNVY